MTAPIRVSAPVAALAAICLIAVRAVDMHAKDAASLMPPKMLAATSADRARISKCYELSARRQGREGRELVEVTLGADWLAR